MDRTEKFQWKSDKIHQNHKRQHIDLTPTTKLAKGTTYTVIIHTNSITDLTGKGLATAYTTKFKTGTV